MKASKVSTEAKVGILVLMGIILLLFMSFRISRLERLKGEVYTALFPSVSGLVINANVEVAGVPVGRVEKIGLDEGMARVWMKIGQTQLHADAEAAVKTHGMLGDKYIEVKPGSPDAPLLPPGQRSPTCEGCPMSMNSSYRWTPLPAAWPTSVKPCMRRLAGKRGRTRSKR